MLVRLIVHHCVSEPELLTSDDRQLICILSDITSTLQLQWPRFRGYHQGILKPRQSDGGGVCGLVRQHKHRSLQTVGLDGSQFPRFGFLRRLSGRRSCLRTFRAITWPLTTERRLRFFLCFARPRLKVQLLGLVHGGDANNMTDPYTLRHTAH